MARNASSFRSKYRAAADHIVTGLATLATALVVVPLVAIFVYLLLKGASSLNLDFFIKNPVPEGESGGGMANAIVGSGVLLGIASLIGVPIGIGAGIYLAEFGRGTKLANAISTDEMRRLNYEIDGNKRDAKEVVKEWLGSRGL